MRLTPTLIVTIWLGTSPRSRDGELLHGGPQPLGHLGSTGFVGGGQNRRELFATVPRHQIAGALNRFLEDLRHPGQAGIAGPVAERVVVQLE